MASMRQVFNTPPGAWEVGMADTSGNLYMRGDTWTDPDTIIGQPSNQPVITARLGQGQSVAIGAGGVFATPAP
jgi:hypothetical protein